MSEAEKRRKDREGLHELLKAIEPARNENIARQAIDIAWYWLNKAESQAMQIKNLEARYARATPCDMCRFNPPSSGDGKPCTLCPSEREVNDE